MSWRRFGVLVSQLPATSLLQTKLRDTIEVDPDDVADNDGRFGPWATENYQLAALLDALQHLTRAVIEVQGSKVDGVFEPTPRPRAKVRGKSPAVVDPAAVEAVYNLLESIRERHRQEVG